MKSAAGFFLSAVLLLTQGCGSGGYVPPDKSLCDASETLTDGTLLCAIRPSRLDAAARDRYAVGSLVGFGYHTAVFPPEGTELRGVYIHMVGTYGRPYNQDTGKFASETFMHEAAQNGFIVLSIAYHNRFLVNGTTECGGHPAVDNCAGKVRREKLTGEDLSAVVDVPVADAVIPRLQRLAAYFEGKGFAFPAAVAAAAGGVNWASLRVGGHSQGAGQALYLAKYFGAAHACMLAGIYDVPDDVPAAGSIADWIADTGTSVDPDRIRAVTATDDPAYSDFVQTYNLLGLSENAEWKSFYADSYHDETGSTIGPHEAAADDPAYAPLRRRACFETGSFEGL